MSGSLQPWFGFFYKSEKKKKKKKLKGKQYFALYPIAKEQIENHQA